MKKIKLNLLELIKGQLKICNDKTRVTNNFINKK